MGRLKRREGAILANDVAFLPIPWKDVAQELFTQRDSRRNARGIFLVLTKIMVVTLCTLGFSQQETDGKYYMIPHIKPKFLNILKKL